MPPARLLPLLLPLLLLVPTAYASGPGAAIDIPRLSAGIEVDGSVAEAAWQDAATISLAYEIRPGDNITPPARTTMRIGHTDDAPAACAIGVAESQCRERDPDLDLVTVRGHAPGAAPQPVP